MGITRIAIKRPISVLMVMLAVLVLGIGSLFGFSLELLPKTEMPVLMVHTAYDGADPETIDVTVSRVIESTAETLNGIETIETYSYENYSLIMLQYEYGTDVASAYLKLQNALAEAKLSLPEGSAEPVIIEMNMESDPSLQISAYAEDEKEVLAFLGEGMVTALENLPAVAKVDVFGGEMNYIRVELKQELLQQYGLDLSTVAKAMAASSFSVPIGTVEQGSQDMAVTSGAEVHNLQEIKDIPLRTEGAGLIRLEDVAKISWAVKDAESISRVNGEANVTISITKSRRAEAMELSRQVNEVVQEYGQQSKAVEFDVLYDEGEEVLGAAKDLGIALLVGLVLAMVVALLLFGNGKTALCMTLSIGFSLMVDLIGMKLMGGSINAVSLGALIVAAGLLLETSVIVLDTYFRLSEDLLDKQDIVLEGTKALKGTLITNVVTSAAICLPLVFFEGFATRLFLPLAYVIFFTAVATILDGAVFLPMLYLWLKPETKREVKVLPKLMEKYETMTRNLMAHKERVIGVAIFAFALSCAAVIFSGKELLPEADQGVVNIEVAFRHGMQNEEVEKKLIVLEELLLETADVESYSTTVGGAVANIRVKLKADGKMSGAEFREMLKERTEDYVGIDINVSNESATSEYETPDAEEVVILGYDLEELTQAAKELANRYRKIPGVLAVLSDAETEGTKLEITIDSMKAVNYGMTAGEVAKFLQELSGGREVMTLSEEGRDYSVCLEYPDGLYDTPQNLMSAGIPTESGAIVPLSEIATLEYTEARDCITRKNGKYAITMAVTCPEHYRTDVRAGMDKAWGKLQTTSSVSLEETNVVKMAADEFKTLYLVIGATVFFLFFVLTVRFESLKHALTMMLSLPLGFFGAFLLVFVTGNTWNLVSVVSVLFLIAWMVCNGLRYTAYANQKMDLMPLEDALVESGKRLLLPMLVTVLGILGLLLPTAVWPGIGTRLISGMAVVMIGGILSGAVLILLLFPVFYQFLYEEEEVEEIGESVEE